LAVFCYHQVLGEPDPQRPGEPTAEDFARDIAIISSTFNVLTFGEAVARLRSGELPARAACVTFDDGYANNYSRAAPILEEAGVPATFFIAGGAVDEGVMWNDLAIESVAAAGGWPELPECGEPLAAPDTELKGAAMTEHLLKQLKYRPLEERWVISREMYVRNVSSELPRLMMSRDMVRDLSDRGFEIGGHTINHPILKEMPDENAEREITGSRDWVTTVTGSTPSSFAYPNGRTGTDYDERHVAMVKKAGFTAAASTDWGLARATSDPLMLPRTGPWWRWGRSLTSGLLRAYVRSYL
jgi:peptidoglycan/xylan/chitin deacetylase (PgdA/CDA1 family)